MKNAAHSQAYAAIGKHHPLTIALHWGTVLCIAVAVTVALLCEIVGDKFWRQLLMETHRQLGLLVLFGIVARIAVRVRYGMADHMRGHPPLLKLLASGAHLALYGVLATLALLGWATTNAHNLALNFVGVLPLPAISPIDSELADTLSDYHVLAAWGLLGLVIAHATAAVCHHFILRDGVLWAMLPGRGEAAETSPAVTAPAAQSVRHSG